MLLSIRSNKPASVISPGRVNIGDAPKERFDLSDSSAAFLESERYGPYIAGRCNNLPVISGWVVSWNARPCELATAAAGHARPGKLICPGRMDTRGPSVLIDRTRNLTLYMRYTRGGTLAFANVRRVAPSARRIVGDNKKRFDMKTAESTVRASSYHCAYREKWNSEIKNRHENSKAVTRQT